VHLDTGDAHCRGAQRDERERANADGLVREITVQANKVAGCYGCKQADGYVAEVKVQVCASLGSVPGHRCV
jgi:hypothetical protein